MSSLGASQGSSLRSDTEPRLLRSHIINFLSLEKGNNTISEFAQILPSSLLQDPKAYTGSQFRTLLSPGPHTEKLKVRLVETKEVLHCSTSFYKRVEARHICCKGARKELHLSLTLSS